MLTVDCRLVAGAWLDFWQADAAGRYILETFVPGLYPGRTRHINVKVQAPGGLLLATQLFFPGNAANQTDGIFDPALLLHIEPTPHSQAAYFDFVLPVQ